MGVQKLQSEVAAGRRRKATRSNERLAAITSAIADAVTPVRVYEALVDDVTVSLGASRGCLWVIADDRTAVLTRSVGVEERVIPEVARLQLGAAGRHPAVDAIRTRAPVWLRSREEVILRYPSLAPIAPKRNFRSACLPLVVEDRAIGVIAFAFDGESPFETEDQVFLQLVARYSAQAMERLRLLEAERQSRARAELLYEVTAAANGAETVEQVFEIALDAVGRAVSGDRSAVLVVDPDGVMRFKAWRGLSDEYRAAVEGHSPWPLDVKAPRIVSVPDAMADQALERYRPLFEREDIGALHFVPLVAAGRLVGKFMAYHRSPRELSASERHLARGIAAQVAEAVVRFRAVDELQQAVKFHDVFTGILSHDLRNPLSAVINAAQLAMLRDHEGNLSRPLSRILSSGARMARLIDQLLDFTRIRVGGGLPLHRVPLDLAEHLRGVIEELGTANAEWSIHFEHRGDPNGMWDADRLQQLFSNLIANAGQHGRGGPVDVVLDGTSPDRVSIAIHNEGEIPADRMKSLFQPMTSTRAGGNGLGLGLYIAQEIARAHHGAVEVRSEPASGTTFHLALPRSAPPEVA